MTGPYDFNKTIFVLVPLLLVIVLVLVTHLIGLFIG
jgi:hypothetical protein